MKEGKLNIRVLSSATKVSGQGVGSAYMEQIKLVKRQDNLFSLYINKDKLPKGEKIDIIHAHTFDPQFCVRMGKKTVNIMYVHCLPSTLDGSIKLPKPLFWILKKYLLWAYKCADEIVVVNPSFIKPLVDLGCIEDNITYIPNHVGEDGFHLLPQSEIDLLKDKYHLPKDRFIVLGCGQVQTRKGVLDFIECAKALPDIEFVWAGGFSFGLITDGYKQLKKVMANPPKNVHFIGIIPRNEMNGVYNLSDMLFMPSFTELMPMSILEAANSSKPILLRDLDIYPSIFFSDYAKGNSVEDFIKEIMLLSSERALYQEYSQKAHHIASIYSKERVGEMWKEYYPRVYRKWARKKGL